MTKKQMLSEICGCSTCKASKATVLEWYAEWLRIKADPSIVKSVDMWRKYCAYLLSAK